MKKAVCITVAAVLCALVFCMTGVGCAKETEQVNYDIYTVCVSLDDMRGFGYGVVLKQENGKIYCQATKNKGMDTTAACRTIECITTGCF